MTNGTTQQRSHSRRLALGCAAVVAGIGSSALLGWVLDLPYLTSLGAGKIPVAPSTAVLFLMYGAAIAIRALFPLHRTARLMSLYLMMAGGAVALLLAVLSLQGIHPAFEHLGVDLITAPGAPPAGHMSPVAALCFVLCSLSFLLSLPMFRKLQWTNISAIALSSLVIAAGFILSLAYLYGAPLLYGSSYIPPAALTCAAFLALGIALLGQTTSFVLPVRKREAAIPSASRILFFVFIVFSAGIVTVGFYYFRHYEKNYLSEVERQLTAITELKKDELRNWRRERLSDAAVMEQNPAFFSLVQRVLEHHDDRAAKTQLRSWLRKYLDYEAYDQVRLFDVRGSMRFALPAGRRPVSTAVQRNIPRVLQTGSVMFLDLYIHDQDQKSYLSILIPVLSGQQGKTAIGVVALRVDPEKYLYPMLRKWPTDSRTAETLLVRRDGDEVVYLNELRFMQNTPLARREPVTASDLPAAKAARGATGLIEGIDYRGVPVIASVNAIPDSPWILIARMDRAEVYFQLRENLWLLVTLVTALLLGAGACVGLVWRQLRIHYYREKSHAADALRKSEERLQLAVRSAGIGIWDWDVVRNELTWDNSMYRLYAMGKEDFGGAYEAWKSTLYSEDLHYVEAEIQAALRGEREYAPEFRIIRPDGTVRFIKADSQTFRDQLGKPLRMIGTNMDITERKRAEESVARTRDLLDATGRMAKVGGWEYTLSSNTLVWTEEVYRIHEVADDFHPTVGTAIDFYSAASRPVITRAVERAIEHGEPFDTELTINTALGREVWVRAIGEVRTRDGKVASILGTFQDITERKLRDNELLNKSAELERFTYTASHDLRSPLVTVKAFLGFLKDDIRRNDQEKIANDLEFMAGAANKMGVLLDELLEMSRVGRVVNEPVRVTFRELADDAMAMVAGRLAGGNVTVQVGEVGSILYGDRQRLGEILQNLIENSIKYMGAQEAPRIEIGTEVHDGSPVYFVRDNGMGIDPRYQDKIFVLFDKLDPKSEGTGLGLALVKRIVELYKGKIWVESEGPGKGSCFKFTLPDAVAGD